MTDRIITVNPDKIICKILVAPDKLESGIIVPDTAKIKETSQRVQVYQIGENIRLKRLQIDDICIIMPGMGEYTYNTFKETVQSRDRYIALNIDDILMIERSKDDFEVINNYILCEANNGEEKTLSGLILLDHDKKARDGRLFPSKYIKADESIEELQSLHSGMTFHLSWFITYKTRNHEYRITNKNDVEYVQ